MEPSNPETLAEFANELVQTPDEPLTHSEAVQLAKLVLVEINDAIRSTHGE